MNDPNDSEIMKILNKHANYGKNIKWEFSGIQSVLDKHNKNAFKAVVWSDSPYGKLSKNLEDFLPKGVKFPACKGYNDAEKGAIQVLKRDDVQAKLKEMKMNGVEEKPEPIPRHFQKAEKKKKKNPFAMPMFNPIE